MLVCKDENKNEKEAVDGPLRKKLFVCLSIAETPRHKILPKWVAL